MTQLQEVIQESHNIVSDLAGNASISSQFLKPLRWGVRCESWKSPIYLWFYVEYWCFSLYLVKNLKRGNKKLTFQINHQHALLLFCLMFLTLFLPCTLCYWSFICWLSSSEENHFNVVSVGQFYRYSLRIYSQSPPLKYGRTFLQEKLFIGDKTFWANLWGLFYMVVLNDRIMQREGEFHKCIFQ